MAITTAADGTIWAAIYGGVTAERRTRSCKIAPQTREDANPSVDRLETLGADRIRWPSPTTAAAASGSRSPLLQPRRRAASAGSRGVVGGGVPQTRPAPAAARPAAAPRRGRTPGGSTPTPAVARQSRQSGDGRAARPDRRVNGDTASIDQICVGPPEDTCSLVYIISGARVREQLPDYENRRPRPQGRALASAAATKKRSRRREARRARAVIVGQSTVTLHGGQSAKVRVTLNADRQKTAQEEPAGSSSS